MAIETKKTKLTHPLSQNMFNAQTICAGMPTVLFHIWEVEVYIGNVLLWLYPETVVKNYFFMLSFEKFLSLGLLLPQKKLTFFLKERLIVINRLRYR